MLNDLLDAQASVDWAIAYIPTLQERLSAWMQRQPYRLIVETDPHDQGWDLVVAYADKQLDPFIFMDIGCILNALRSGLDILVATLWRRNGVIPNGHTRFLIRETASDVNGAWDGAEREKRLSVSDVVKLKSLKAYKGGDTVLWPLHQLDIIRKHHRFVAAAPEIDSASTTHMYWRPAPLGRERLDNKTVLCQIARGVGFTPHKGNTLITARIVIDEAALNLHREPAIDLVRAYARRVADIIAMFDKP